MEESRIGGTHHSHTPTRVLYDTEYYILYIAIWHSIEF